MLQALLQGTCFTIQIVNNGLRSKGVDGAKLSPGSISIFSHHSALAYAEISRTLGVENIHPAWSPMEYNLQEFS